MEVWHASFAGKVTLPIPWLWVHATSELQHFKDMLKHFIRELLLTQQTTKYESVMDKKPESVKLAMHIVKEDLPFAKYESLIEFKKLQELKMADNVSYGSRSAADDFLTAISDVIDEGLNELLHGTKYISILIDENTDIKTEKLLVCG